MAAILFLRNLDKLRPLSPALLTCRHFYTLFKQYREVEPGVLRNQITPALLPYSVALLDVSRWPRPPARSSVKGLLDTLYNEPAQLTARASSLPVRTLWQMVRVHELVRKFSTMFARETWSRLLPGDRDNDGIVALTPAEDSRFCRAFYRLELFYQLFRDKSCGLNDDFVERAQSWFLSRHPPWENEQIGCAHEFLEAKFRQASLDVIAHDIFFGELSIDYLTTGEDNFWNQLWLSQGLEFVDQLMNADSYEAKEPLLSSAFGKGYASFPQAAEPLSRAIRDDDKMVEEYTQEELLPVASAQGHGDLERGPYEAWFAAHRGIPAVASVMPKEHAWFRERAYVLWDWDRVQSAELLAVIGAGPPEEAIIGGFGEEYDMMQESFDERSKLWQKCCSGYWHGGEGARGEESPDD